jgi:fructose-bisphosphate aldolase, class I
VRITRKVQKILSYYETDNPGTKSNLAKILMNGRVGGSGKLLILAMDQGFEHGPDRSFSSYTPAYDPHYPYKLAINASLSAYAAPLGWLEAGAGTFFGQLPTILKINSSNSLLSNNSVPDQAITASIDDALRLGCSAIGFTIYPGSDASLDQFEELRDLALEAKAAGLAVIVWSYPRGNISKDGERAIDVISYGAHMAALLGAHIIKVKLPTDHLEHSEIKKSFETNQIAIKTMEDRVKVVVRSCFNGRRIVIFSGMEMKDADEVVNDAKVITAGGGFGSIIGRNCFQRPYGEAIRMLKSVAEIYQKS